MLVRSGLILTSAPSRSSGIPLSTALLVDLCIYTCTKLFFKNTKFFGTLFNHTKEYTRIIHFKLSTRFEKII